MAWLQSSGNLELASIFYYQESVSLLLLPLTLETGTDPSCRDAGSTCKAQAQASLLQGHSGSNPAWSPPQCDPPSESGNFAPVVKRIEISRPREKARSTHTADAILSSWLLTWTILQFCTTRRKSVAENFRMVGMSFMLVDGSCDHELEVKRISDMEIGDLMQDEGPGAPSLS